MSEAGGWGGQSQHLGETILENEKKEGGGVEDSGISIHASPTITCTVPAGGLHF